MHPSMEIRTPSGRSAHLALLAAALVLPAVARAQEAPAAESIPESQLAARVNGEDISLQQLSQAVNQYVAANRLTPDSGVTIPELQKTVLDRLIASALVDQRGRELQIVATPEEVDDRIAALRASAGSPADFRLMLTVQNLTEPELKRQVARQVTGEKVIEAEVFARMKFSDKQVKQYYDAHLTELSGQERIHVRHVFVRLRPDMTAEDRAAARERIDHIKGRLDAGEEFRDLAVELSEDSAAASGGDLGWIGRDEVSGPFQLVAFSLPVGQTSEVVATDYGYHIVEVLEHEEARTMAQEEARPLIEERLRDQRVPTAVREYIAGLREKAQIEKFFPPGGDS